MPVEITNAATEVLINLSLGVLTLLGALAGLYIQKGIQKLQAETVKIQDERTRELFYVALDRLDDVAEKTVNKIEQTIKKKLLQAVADGSMSKDAIKTLARDAYNEITRTLEPDYYQVITETLGDSETYILNLIEQKLELVKYRRSSPVPLPPGNTVVNISPGIITGPEISG